MFKWVRRMNLYEAIYVRKSIRNFKKEAIDDKILSGILEFVEEIEPIFPGIGVKVEIIDNVTKRGRVGGLVNVSAPYYIALYAEKKEKRDLHAGYIMEHISLYLNTKGIGSCFLGMAKRKDKKMEESGYDFVTALAFGLPKGSLFRHDYEAKRLSMDELCAYKERPKTWVKEILDTARLAPSSYNSQPWRFVVYENRIHVFCKKAVMANGTFGKFAELNLGIMFANVMIAAEEIWVDLDLIRLNNITHKTLPNNQYVLSVLLKQ